MGCFVVRLNLSVPCPPFTPPSCLLAAVQSRIVLDPYAHTVISRRQYGQLGADIQYGQPGVLGLARTWPQAAAAVPDVAPAFDWEGDRPLGLPMEQLVRGRGGLIRHQRLTGRETGHWACLWSSW